MTELACHQLEVCNWAAKRMPVSIMGMGDIVYWKDGREVYDSVNVTYRYSDGTKIAYSGGLFQTGDLILAPLKREVTALRCALEAPKKSGVEGAWLLAVHNFEG